MRRGWVCAVDRTDWSYCRGNGPDQPRHARCWKEPGRNGEMLWSLRSSVEKVGYCAVWCDVVTLVHCCWTCESIGLPVEYWVSFLISLVCLRSTLCASSDVCCCINILWLCLQCYSAAGWQKRHLALNNFCHNCVPGAACCQHAVCTSAGAPGICLSSQQVIITVVTLYANAGTWFLMYQS